MPELLFMELIFFLLHRTSIVRDFNSVFGTKDFQRVSNRNRAFHASGNETAMVNLLSSLQFLFVVLLKSKLLFYSAECLQPEACD